ncbi:hypothetical protein [Streptomyces rochei]|uniref:hypothetical protein n=1 Tax=Streptomyces rochei TaxID=1928 RepID=UPI0033B143E6
MSDGSKTNDEPEGRMARLRRRLSEWQIQQQVARGLAYGVSSNAVSLIVLWAKSGGLGS